MFIDKVEITIKAGAGGNGHTSFLRDRQTMHGGPDGGDGGRGGDVIFVGSTRTDNLIEFRYTKKFCANDGENGTPRNKHGADGKDLEIPVPLGTKIYKHAGGGDPQRVSGDTTKTPTGDMLLVADITAEGQKFVALRGGAGGRGNSHFATARRQTPNFSHSGVKTEPYNLTLELETIADVGIIGLPNVGKSTFLSIVTRANPKIANYPFTTLHPNIGVMYTRGKSIVLADIPGLIEGASRGVGLGHDFLKHVNRTRLLVHMLDAGSDDPERDREIINRELDAFSPNLSKKPQITVLNKCDCVENIETNGADILRISCATRTGIDELVAKIADEVDKLPKPAAPVFFAKLENAVDKNAFDVEKIDGVYVVSGALVDNLSRGVVLSDTESTSYFHRRLEQSGVIRALRDAGMVDGDTVQIGTTEFVWQD